MQSAGPMNSMALLLRLGLLVELHPRARVVLELPHNHGRLQGHVGVVAGPGPPEAHRVVVLLQQKMVANGEARALHLEAKELVKIALLPEDLGLALPAFLWLWTN